MPDRTIQRRFAKFNKGGILELRDAPWMGPTQWENQYSNDLYITKLHRMKEAI